MLYFHLNAHIPFRILVIFGVTVQNFTFIEASAECNQDTLDRSFVTHCSPGYCEPILESEKDGKRPNEWPNSKDEVVQVVSSRQEYRFKVFVHKSLDTTDIYYEESHLNGSIFVETDVKYQRILGFGTTLTDASCKNVDDLSEETRANLISDYFSPEVGIGLNLIKVPIGSTKYSYTNYVLEQPDINQVELSPYDVDQRIPIIRDALKAAGKFKNRVKIVASSATAPAELKINNKMVHGGYLKQDKIRAYASYLLGFIKAYKSYDLNIWSLILSELPATIGNFKNSSDLIDYSSMAMRPSDSTQLIQAITELRDQLPTDTNRSFRILLLGDSKSYIPVWADAVLSRTYLADKVAGLAFTCDDSSDFTPYDNLIYFTKRYPSKYLVTTQSSANAPMKLGSWMYAENYATEIIKSLEFGSVGWIDFNMALNLEAGPCINDRFKADASIIVDPKKGIYYRNPMLYAIGHLSRYVKPGSVRVKSTFISSVAMFASQQIAFITPNNYLVVVVMNNNIGPMPVSIGINKRTKVQSMLATKSFNTFIFRL